MALEQAGFGRLRTRLAVLLALATLAPRTATAATGPGWCLPPLFEGGHRLHALPAPTSFWLPPLLRQHQLCHQALAHPDEPRVILIGSSAALGFPLPADETVTARMNQQLTDHQTPGRVFNLGWVNTYQLRDAFVLRAALAYRPDLIIHLITLADFVHVAPAQWPALGEFFRVNGDTVVELAAAPLPGLAEPLKRYGYWIERNGRFAVLRARLHSVGALLRAAVHSSADALAHWADPVLPSPSYRTSGRQQSYDCRRTLEGERKNFRDWSAWNILAYLQDVHERYGIAVLIVNVPIAHEPVDACYNVRHSAGRVAEFNIWLEAETMARGLAYVDLHDLLPPEQFFDSLHPTAEGHARIAERLTPVIETLLRARGRQPDGAGKWAPPGALGAPYASQ